MTDSVDTFLRLAARKAGRAFARRETYRIMPDPTECFALAPIRVVAEELLQVVAYGDPDGQPSIAHEALPLSRATAFLEPVCDALEGYLRRASAAGAARIYVPHANALDMLALLGPRYERNQEASPKVQRLGYLSRILREIAYEPGQQVIVSIADELCEHIVSGGSPIEDAQLRYLLTWLDPPAGMDVAAVAEQNALWPAAGMLFHLHDKQIDKLRHDLKAKRGDVTKLRRDIERIQDFNAMQEWKSLTDARDALWRLGLAGQAGLQPLMEENVRQLSWALDDHMGSPKYAIPMTKKYAEFGYAHTVARMSTLEVDDRAFEVATQSGNAVRGSIEGRRTEPKTAGSKRREVLIVRTEQRLLRLREGMGLKVRRARIDGRVISYERAADGSSRFEFVVDNGVRSLGDYAIGAAVEFIEGSLHPFRPFGNVLKAVGDKPHITALLQGAVTRGSARVDPRLNLAELVSQMRTGR